MANINIINTELIGKVDPDKFLYAGLGMNVIPFTGPQLTVGYNMKAFCAELTFTYGFNKTDDVYFYGMGASIQSAFKYQALRAALRLGYALPLSRQVLLTPQAGVAYNYIYGKEIDGVTATNSDFMKSFNTCSAILGAKLTFNFSGHLGLCVTPEYDFAIAKEDNYDIVKASNNKIKGWTEGFGLSVELMYKF